MGACACRNVVVIADGGHQGTGLIIAHRRAPGAELVGVETGRQQVPPQVRARVEHVFARMKTWKILRTTAYAATDTLADLAHTH